MINEKSNEKNIVNNIKKEPFLWHGLSHEQHCIHQ